MSFIAHLYMYIHLYIIHCHFFHWSLPTLHRMLPSLHKFLICTYSYAKHQILISVEIFDVLCVISHVQVDVFPVVPALHDLEHQRFISINSIARFAQSGTSNIFYQDLWCFTRDITRASRCLPNCAQFALSGSFFRYFTRTGYLLTAGYVL